MVIQSSQILQALQPKSLELFCVAPVSWLLKTAYYLGYHRNAWNETTVFRYFSDSVSFDLETVKSKAEKARVQGNVFKIVAIPVFVFKYAIGPESFKYSIGLYPVNRGSNTFYETIMNEVTTLRRWDFWKSFPPINESKLLVSRLLSIPNKSGFEPFQIYSKSIGTDEKLQWKVVKPEQYIDFLRFTDLLLEAITRP